MRPVLDYPTIHTWGTGYLRAALTAAGEALTVDVKDRTAKGRRVIFRTDGGDPANEVMQRVRFSIRIFGKDELDTEQLSMRVMRIMQAARGNGPVNSTTVRYPFPVEDASGPMYYLTGELVVRGQQPAA